MKKLVSTNNLSHSDWLMYRKQGIGGSDAGAICGLNPYMNAIHVYADKTSEIVSEFDNEAMRQGRDLEEYVARRFCEETGNKVRRANAIFYNEKYPFMLANVDRMLVGTNIGLECKTANVFQADKWKDGEVPAHYMIQCYHYMAVTGADTWYIAVVILGQDFKFVKLERDEEIIQNLIEIESKFWNDNVLAKIMPDPDGSKASDEIISQYFKKATSKEIISLEGFDEMLERREDIVGLMGKLDTEKKKIDQLIKLYMKEAEEAINAKYRISWKNTETRKLDIDRLKLERPDIYSEYCKMYSGRRFVVKTA